MARATSSMQCDSVATYMDGVHVKIAEAYKPPRKIALPAAYNNRLPDASRYSYDFSLERSVLQKMSEWRKARLANSEARQLRLEENKLRKKENSPSPPPASSTTSSSTSSSPSTTTTTATQETNQLPVKTAPVPETTILTPQPLSPPANDLHEISNNKSQDLNYADFDNDTSSPFDNMLLKSINDKEELAQLLQPSHWKPSGKLENIINDLTIGNDGQNNHNQEINDSIIDKTDDHERIERKTDSLRIVSLIVEELQRELERPILENWKPWTEVENLDVEKNCVTNEKPPSHSKALTNILMDLSEDDQKLARHLSDMGFPLTRAARAIHKLGGSDNKKIVEYLLAIQSLEDDLEISEEAAIKALELTEFDQEKAKVFHQNLTTLRDLGFSEDQASIALIKCNIDRDKALDLLIT
ncbi:transcription initiation factor TFIID subunit 1 [Leptopilina heterotoma]|uniref:transcription initiation factor TFIID subunit 1 n=1 Tax=Leptopilina heterotoma TaxID=63436 RepID=UPI001CA7CCB1|nr:transcription initiation factor TFIID subunit 1 [Leptopilina heterotoma]